MELRHRITQLRLASNLNKAELARKVGVSDVTVSYWESGQVKVVGSDNLLGLSRAFNMPVSEIIEDPMLPYYRTEIAKKAIETARGDQGDQYSSVEAIIYALTLDNPKAFLSAWMGSEWARIQEQWPDAPDVIYPKAWLDTLDDE